MKKSMSFRFDSCTGEAYTRHSRQHPNCLSVVETVSNIPKKPKELSLSLLEARNHELNSL